LPFNSDILFIDASHRILFIADHCQKTTLATSPEPAVAALCLKAGFVREHKIELNQIVEYPRKYPLRHSEQNETPVEQIIEVIWENQKKHTENYADRIVLGSLLLENNQLTEAQSIVEPLLEPPHVSADALNVMAKAAALQGHFQQAINLFSYSLDLEPHRYTTVFFIKRTLQVSKSPEHTEQFVLELLENHPDNTHLISLLCRHYLDTNQIDMAFEFINSKLQSAEASPDIMRLLGDVYLRKGNHTRAAEAYLSYLNAEPIHSSVRDLKTFVTVHKYRKALLNQESER
jgi:predicted Zn-dependent protease